MQRFDAIARTVNFEPPRRPQKVAQQPSFGIVIFYDQDFCVLHTACITAR